MILLLVGWLAAATPEADQRARELYENGAVLYEEGRYEDAVAAWEEAWRLSGRPLLLYNMANAMERLGRWEEAMDLLNRYRAYAPADERDVLDRRIRNIERRAVEQEVVAAAVRPEAARVPLVPVALGATAAVGLGVGAGFAGVALAARAEAAERCVAVDGERYCPADAADALARDRRASAVADVALAVGTVAGATGLGIWLADGRAGLVVGPARVEVVRR